MLLKVWLAGLLSATGIGVLRSVWHDMVLGGGALVAVVLLFGVGACTVCQVLGFSLAQRQVRQVQRGTVSALVTTAVLVVGGCAMIALNRVLVSGAGFLPPFGPVSVALLCAPYPIVFTLCTMHRAAAVAAALASAAMIGAGVLPLRTAQEHLAADGWRHAHPATPRDLIAAVDWPGGEQTPLTTGPFGTRVVVFFQDSNIDGMSQGVVTVSPAGTDPCRDLTVAVTYDTVPENELPDDDTMSVPDPGCTPSGPDAWELYGTGFRGYATLLHGVLVRVTVDDDRPDDDLAAVARSLHPLDDHQLWRYTGGWPGWAWPLT
ncbi:hypothetical protein [Actinacidiphila rubida]|uniref:hypothetical protein n=1 Tax=Actinacidiphila rubida TaxID=310780 RepID=UPI00094471C5|nr:hypothetical protein [Actinacidiphila rubida]